MPDKALSVPPVAHGPDETAPGPWAKFALHLPWLVAKEGDKILSPLLSSLHQQSLKRELVLREDINWSGNAFFLSIGESLRHVEAIYIYMTGDVCVDRCDHCLRGRGIFPLCVVNQQPGAPKDCANCWWKISSRKRPCSFTGWNLSYEQQLQLYNITPAMREDICQLLAPLKNTITTLNTRLASARALEDLRTNEDSRKALKAEAEAVKAAFNDLHTCFKHTG
ncbi:hypothetical protein PENCOP_c009G00700 [Penicillium coprophilum]|uniref:Uncharacterized protein n=1 Tax=Penicillium coprophilum TaxID=36646 RepID=A0A1V6UHH2_9EURO|nr:hypothetical protein PENCOP_c009G00700 [Penicillium coprophilum]